MSTRTLAIKLGHNSSHAGTAFDACIFFLEYSINLEYFNNHSESVLNCDIKFHKKFDYYS